MNLRVKGFISFIAFLFLNMCFCLSASAESPFVIKQAVPDKAGNLIIITGTGNPNSAYKLFRLSNPDRLVIDIDNATLFGSKKIINIDNENIKELKISQFSTEPNVVRLVLTADSPGILKKIRVSKTKNTILLGLGEISANNVAGNPLYRDKEFPAISTEPAPQNDKEAIIKLLQDKIDHNIVLKNIKHYDNRVIISGSGILSVTQPVLLENPSRIVFDIPDGVIESSEFVQPVSLKNGDLIRIGQFDNNTVRVVVETQNPDLYKTVISPDMQSILIAPQNEISFAEFPDSSSSGEIQDIKIDKKDHKTTRITLISAKPIIHDLQRSNSPNKLSLDIYNLRKPKQEVVAALAKTGQFHGIEFKPLEKYTNGSEWVFPLNKTTKVESRLSIDGRMLDIILKDIIPAASAKPKPRNLKGQIVIDAGHGGAEPGAMRAGIYEKDITIAVAQRVKRNLQRAGISVVMTREGDESVSLKQRTVITNEVNPDAFVSIHINSSESPLPTGLETYYYTPQSKELAESIHTKLVNYINSPDRKIRTARFYVIRNTQVPAILAEIGYISNDGERYELLSDERQDATAKAISEGIINFLKSK